MNSLKKNEYEASFSDGVVIFKNINTTLAFARYSEKAKIEYIFVNPIFRRKGLAGELLKIIEEKTKIKPKPENPISPLGEKLFKTNKVV